MRCLETVGKHVNIPRAIARQLLSKWIPTATDTHATAEVLLDSNNGNGAFVPKCYKQDQSSSGVGVVSSSFQRSDVM
jgi:hypothetical protein